MAQIEAYDDENFAWERRCEKLRSKIATIPSDIVTLVECDHYEDFWKGALDEVGLDA